MAETRVALLHFRSRDALEAQTTWIGHPPGRFQRPLESDINPVSVTPDDEMHSWEVRVYVLRRVVGDNYFYEEEA